MPSEITHIQQAVRNQIAIDQLLGANGRIESPEWVATIAFYKALHIVEAVFSRDKAIAHRQTHERRLAILKQTRKYENICKHYEHLWRASLVARYLRVDDGPAIKCFTDYLTVEQVRSEILGHRLRQVQRSAMRFLTDNAKDALRKS